MNRRQFSIISITGIITTLGGCLSEAMNNGVKEQTVDEHSGDEHSGDEHTGDARSGDERSGDRSNYKEQRTENRSYHVADEAVLTVHNRNGPVNVVTHDESTIDVHAEIRANSTDSLHEVSVTATNTKKELRLVTEFDDGDRHDQATVSMNIRCPSGIPVDAVTTTNGSVEITDVTGDFESESKNGSIVVKNVDGVVSLTTSNGSISATNISGMKEAKTSNGTIDIEIPAVEDKVTVENSNGNIDAALDPGLNAKIDAEATNGSVSVQGLDLASMDRSEQDLSGTLHSGRHSIRFESSNGSIDLSSLRG